VIHGGATSRARQPLCSVSTSGVEQTNPGPTTHLGPRSQQHERSPWRAHARYIFITPDRHEERFMIAQEMFITTQTVKDCRHDARCRQLPHLASPTSGTASFIRKCSPPRDRIFRRAKRMLDRFRGAHAWLAGSDRAEVCAAAHSNVFGAVCSHVCEAALVGVVH